jgi:hypothetical protein
MRDRAPTTRTPTPRSAFTTCTGVPTITSRTTSASYGLYQPNFFHEHWLHSFADGWSLGGTYEYHSGFPWTPTYPVTETGIVTGPNGAPLLRKQSVHLDSARHLYRRPAEHTAPPRLSPGPSTSFPTSHNVNFPTGTGGESYFTPPALTPLSVKLPRRSPRSAPAPPPVMERNSFTGPMYQSVNASLAKEFSTSRGAGDRQIKRGIEFAWTLTTCST